jgi:hypothetical protein
VRQHGLKVHEVDGITVETRELVVTNPAFPYWGRIIAARDGLLEWAHWCDIDHDDGAGALARVITGILVGGSDPDRYGNLVPQWPGELRSHP